MRWPSASKMQPLLFGLGQRLDALALDLGRLQHGRDQLALAALDFGVLHLDLCSFSICWTFTGSAITCCCMTLVWMS